jgi:hypothetical protein
VFSQEGDASDKHRNEQSSRLLIADAQKLREKTCSYFPVSMEVGDLTSGALDAGEPLFQLDTSQET